MRIEYIAFDSFGIKSSCIKLMTDDIVITIDPGIAEETGSFPLPWHTKLGLVAKYQRAIARACADSDVIIISHYHYDHHIPQRELYKDKILLIKDPKKSINKSQTDRAAHFLDQIGVRKAAKEIHIADGKTFRFGRTRISFSGPLWHGIPGTNLGFVLASEIADSERTLIHSSDIDGPVIEQYAEAIIKRNPDILILDGAPTYLLGYIHAYYNMARAIFNLVRIIERTDTDPIVLDHHVVRDYRYPELYKVAFDAAKERGIRLCTAAELLGRKPAVLAGFMKYGPTKWKRWQALGKRELRGYISRAKKLKLVR
jgi:hypothetical protein